MRSIRLLGIFLAFGVTHASAGFERWTSETEKDPFSGGEKVIVDYAMTLRSAVIMFCDTAESGIEIRVVPGYVYDRQMEDFEPQMEFAIDGERIDFPAVKGSVAVVGDNLTAISVTLNKEQGLTIVKAFAAAQRQIAIKDGMSDRPHLLRAAGSTKAGQTIVGCVGKQK